MVKEPISETHHFWMRKALEMAKAAALRNEVPVAALIVGPDGHLLASAINTRERAQTPLGHAELIALHKASQKNRNWRLEDCTLYVTLEPCLMCAGAIQQARLKTVVYAAKDSKAGAVDSLYHILQDARLNHQCEVISGVEALAASELLTQFFKNKRASQKETKGNIIYRERAEALIVHQKKILAVRLQDPLTQKEIITLPGGGIDPGETALSTALREAKEETGYDVTLIPNLSVIKTFDFHWKGAVRPCRTEYFLGQLVSPQQVPSHVKDADYNKGYFWLPIKEIPKVWAAYPEALAAIQKLLKKQHLLKNEDEL